MEHSSHLHPEFGLLSPTPRLRREIRIAVTSLLLGIIAGAICVSAVVALRHADSPALVEASSAPLPQETKPGTEPGVAHANDAGTATSRASAEAPTPRSGETSAQAAAPPPPSAIAPKTRVVRIRRAVDSPAIARLPLGRGEARSLAAGRSRRTLADLERRRSRWQRSRGRSNGETCRAIGREGKCCRFAAAEEGAADGSQRQLQAQLHRERSVVA